MDKIYISDLVIKARHGLHPHEKTTPQRFRVNVVLSVDLGKVSRSDDIADTVDWSELRDSIIEVVQNNSFDLVERLAGAVADHFLKDKRVAKVEVSIDKLDAFDNGVPGVKIERSN